MASIPLLDFFDDDPYDLIAGWEHDLAPDVEMPRRVVLAFLGQTVQDYVDAHRLTEVHALSTIMGKFPIFAGEHEGERFGMMACPSGAPWAVTAQHMLATFGTQATIAVGSCGELRPLSDGTMFVPTRALREEGTSFAYAPPSRWIEPTARASQACREAIVAAGFATEDVVTWTTDAIYRETPARIRARCEEGCDVVEMECSALAACARFTGMEFGQILFRADSLASVEKYNPRDWGRSSREIALTVAIDAARL